VDIYRCYELWTLARQITDVPGAVLEVGVWRGGTGAVLAEAVRDQVGRKVFLADTFHGVIKAGARDTQYKGGEHSDTSEEIVRTLLSSMGLNDTVILTGAFPDDTHQAIEGPIAFLHCDVDVYDSTRDIVEWCLPRLSPGAIMVFDDYGFFGCDGVTRYCDELRGRKGFRFVHNLNGHAVFFRIADHD
jgi:O-methyltransferase